MTENESDPLEAQKLKHAVKYHGLVQVECPMCRGRKEAECTKCKGDGFLFHFGKPGPCGQAGCPLKGPN